MDIENLDFTTFLESASEGNKWKVMIIEEGLSKNGKLYPAEVLRSAAPLFEKSPVRFYEFKNDFFNHLPISIEKIRPEGFPLQTAGFLENVKFETINVEGREVSGLTGVLNFLDTPKVRELKNTITEAWKKGMKKLLGLSINADGGQMLRMMNGVPVAIVNSIKHVLSTDLVTQPAAGGGLLKLIESINSQGGEEKMFKKFLEALKAWKPKLFESIDVANVTEEETLGIVQNIIKESSQHKAFAHIESLAGLVKDKKFEEADGALKKILESEVVAPAAAAAAPAAAAAAPAADDSARQAEAARKLKEAELDKRLEAADKRIALNECKDALNTKLAESKLPEPVKNKIRNQFKDRVFESKDLDATIKIERETLAALVESQSDFDFGDVQGSFIEKEPTERLQASMDLMFGKDVDEAEKKNYEGIDAFSSLREAYVAFTDDPQITGKMGPKAMKRLQEADATTLSYALGYSMQRRMLMEYKKLEPFWRKIASVVPLKDFKLQERIRWGGFGLLPQVQAARTVAGTPIDSTTPTYPQLGFPVDQEATYAAKTVGGLVTITRRMVIDDDLQILGKLPGKIARAADNTLNRFVFDLMLNVSAGTINGGTIYDSVALYAVAHNNYQTTAFGFDSLDALLMKMYHQVEFGNKTLVTDNPLTAGATTLNVTTGDGQFFKAGDIIWIEGELISVSSVATDALTIVRGLFGTSGAQHAQNVAVYKGTDFLALQNPIIWVPRSLRSKAMALRNSEKNPESAENAVNTIRESFEPIVSPYLRGDENNYYAQARMSDIEGIEVGFIGGAEDPALILQDNPTTGNVFTYDQINYKARHEYGGAVVDFRAFAGGIVA